MNCPFKYDKDRQLEKECEKARCAIWEKVKGQCALTAIAWHLNYKLKVENAR